MQKLLILILSSLLISCGKKIDQSPKALKKQDLDGDKILESSGDDLIANIPAIQFNIPFLETENRLIRSEGSSKEILKKNIISQVASQLNKDRIDLIKLGYGPKFNFRLNRNDDLSDIRFTIADNLSNSTITSLKLRISLDNQINTYRFVTVSDSQLRNKDHIKIDLSDYAEKVLKHHTMTIEVFDFYFKRRSEIINFQSFLSDLSLKSYKLSIFQNGLYKSYFISKTIDIHNALKITGYKTEVDNLYRIHSIDNRVNSLPLKSLKDHKYVDGFWALTNTQGQNINIKPLGGEDIKLIYFTKSDFIKYGLRQKIETLSFNKTNKVSLKETKNLYSYEILEIQGHANIPKQLTNKKSRSWRDDSDDHRGTCAGRCKSKLPNSMKKCTYNIYNLGYNNLNITKDNIDQFFNTNPYQVHVFENQQDNSIFSLKSKSKKSIVTGVQRGSCPKSIKKSKKKTKKYPTAFTGKIKILKRFTY